ncbi:MAG: glycerol dehydrogenase [Synechococcus sp.]|nr:glycerol dehydrogenase [Synechococcus sp.]
MPAPPGQPRLQVFAAPERYVQGPGATAELASELVRLGLQGPLLIVAGRHARHHLEPIWRATLPAAGLPVAVETFGGECTAAEIERLALAGQRQGAIAVVGAGGGKTIDAARGAADILSVPAVATPTLASTDAPCSALSVLYDAEGRFEAFRFYRRHPLLVLVDTAVIARSPRRQLVAGIGDALATWFEARTVREAASLNQIGGLPTTTGTALARLCFDILLSDGPAACAALEAQAVTPALERLVEANTLLSGLGFESGGLAVAHSVHNGLTIAPGSHGHLHGEKVAFGLLTQLVLEGRPQGEIDEVLHYQHRIGLPITLAEVGVEANDDDLLEAIAVRATAAGETCHHEPFPVEAGPLADAMRAADRLGRRMLS